MKKPSTIQKLGILLFAGILVLYSQLEAMQQVVGGVKQKPKNILLQLENRSFSGTDISTKAFLYDYYLKVMEQDKKNQNTPQESKKVVDDGSTGKKVFDQIYATIRREIFVKTLAAGQDLWGEMPEKDLKKYCHGIVGKMLLFNHNLLKALVFGELDLSGVCDYTCGWRAGEFHGMKKSFAKAFENCPKFNTDDIGLFVSDCAIPTIVGEIAKFTDIKNINLNYNFLVRFDEKLFQSMPCLEKMSCDCNFLSVIPDITKFRYLVGVSLRVTGAHCFRGGKPALNVKDLPRSLKFIDLGNNGLDLWHDAILSSETPSEKVAQFKLDMEKRGITMKTENSLLFW